MRAPFRFPPDLLALERAWLDTYAGLAEGPATAGTTVLRRRLIALSGHLCTHPYWETPAGPGRTERSMSEQPTTPRPKTVPVTWAPSQTGPCARCHSATCRYGLGASPLCAACKALRQAQYGG
ncbi:hypothetical protein OG625_40300 (plasmid) [Streptomyces sp. NBC_01351]|uniref:hypothetical protein n=1 Tax=Streptomyces sp. NBC_01351 TaxID=2903833 RepID=UPI002E2EA376|nr:hypothetical protein [Streptomyces sp. NBC_01351]